MRIANARHPLLVTPDLESDSLATSVRHTEASSTRLGASVDVTDVRRRDAWLTCRDRCNYSMGRIRNAAQVSGNRW